MIQNCHISSLGENNTLQETIESKKYQRKLMAKNGEFNNAMLSLKANFLAMSLGDQL